jgi:hypothetical protein
VTVSSDDGARQYALAQLDMAARVLPGLMATLEFNVRYANLLRSAYGITAQQYEALDFEAREHALNRGRLDLVAAAGVTRRAYEAMPRNSKPRSDVLLRGAAVLGIVTDWPGWEG